VFAKICVSHHFSRIAMAHTTENRWKLRRIRVC
jgi:hypothetical protein